MRPMRLSLVGMIVSALVGALGVGSVAQSEGDSFRATDPMAASYFTGRTVAELPHGATLFEATDPRMSGTFTGEVDLVIASTEGAAGPCVFRGIARIENEDGAWRGVGRGFAAGRDRLHWNEHYWFIGEGAYKGLSAVMSGSVRDDDIAGLLIEGVVFPGAPPPAEAPTRITPFRMRAVG